MVLGQAFLVAYLACVPPADVKLKEETLKLNAGRLTGVTGDPSEHLDASRGLHVLNSQTGVRKKLLSVPLLAVLPGTHKNHNIYHAHLTSGHLF